MSGTSSDQLENHIDPWRACRRDLLFVGRARLEQMPRLASAVLSLAHTPPVTAEMEAGAEAAEYEIRFGQDPQGRAVVTGRVAAVLRLTCQRCLAEIEIPVNATIGLALIRRDEEVDALPDHLDPWLVADDRVNPLEMVEDELLLAIPQIPRHPSGSCRARSDPGLDASIKGGTEEPRQPFAILATLRKTPRH